MSDASHVDEVPHEDLAVATHAHQRTRFAETGVDENRVARHELRQTTRVRLRVHLPLLVADWRRRERRGGAWRQHVDGHLVELVVRNVHSCRAPEESSVS